MAKGPGTVLPLPDVIPELLRGGFENELRRSGEVVLQIERTTLDADDQAHVEHLLRALG